MLQLTVVAPNKQKAELECQQDATFGDVKAQVEKALGVPRDKQKLLCNGKERKDDKESLAAAKVKTKAKLMLMLVPGYTMPAAPAADAATEDTAPVSQAVEAAPMAVDVEGELPAGSGDVAVGSGGGTPGIFHVRHGRNKYHVRVPQGLHAATIRDLAAYLGTAFFPGVPVEQFRFVVKGKTPELSVALGPEGSLEASAMLLFREGFHVTQEGAAWLQDRTAELVEAEGLISKLAIKIDANFVNEDTIVQIAEARALVEVMEQSVESVQVRETKIPEMAQFRDRVVAAMAKLDEFRSKITL